MALKSVEEQIRKAMAEGEFDNLPGKGQPLDLNAYFETPEDLRMGYSMLKNSNFVPEEVQMLKDIEALREQLAASDDESQRQRLGKIITEKTLAFRMLVEKQKRTK
ncbi:MAG TPA: DUF1992 domain-containing protein [Pyrinomonadaceae bacterium]|jgi:ribonucleotide reductase beta subunit family protein with ferritin-like domain